jgi:hypothetical protein
VPIELIKTIGVAANSSSGISEVEIIDVDNYDINL